MSLSELDLAVSQVTNGRRSSWQDLLQRWQRFVADVESGYAFSIGCGSSQGTSCGYRESVVGIAREVDTLLFA
jgi:hypothetical protein